MKEVTTQDLLDITADEYRSLGYFDMMMVVRAWCDAERVQGLPDEVYKMQYGDIDSFRSFLAEKKAAYYAEPHENFFIWKAVQRALDKGVTLVYVEDLS